jgi:hypothetical protein
MRTETFDHAVGCHEKRLMCLLHYMNAYSSTQAQTFQALSSIIQKMRKKVAVKQVTKTPEIKNYQKTQEDNPLISN